MCHNRRTASQRKREIHDALNERIQKLSRKALYARAKARTALATLEATLKSEVLCDCSIVSPGFLYISDSLRCESSESDYDDSN